MGSWTVLVALDPAGYPTHGRCRKRAGRFGVRAAGARTSPVHKRVAAHPERLHGRGILIPA